MSFVSLLHGKLSKVKAMLQVCLCQLPQTWKHCVKSLCGHFIIIIIDRYLIKIFRFNSLWVALKRHFQFGRTDLSVAGWKYLIYLYFWHNQWNNSRSKHNNVSVIFMVHMSLICNSISRYSKHISFNFHQNVT